MLRELTKGDTSNDLLKSIMERFRKIVDFDSAAILLNGNNGQLEPIYIASSQKTFSISKTITTLAIAEDKALRIPDAVGDTIFKEGKSIIQGKIRSVLAAPIKNEKKIRGVVFLNKQKPGFYDDHHLRILKAVCPFLALAMSYTRRVSSLKKKIEFELEKSPPLAQMIGNGPAMHDIKSIIRKAASASSTVLILGQTGTGKELIAHWLHDLGPGHQKPFVPVNCGAMPENLVESELFGYERGAFSGARRRKPGKLELASGGTLFLDEIGELPLAMQVKLLRALEYKSFYRLGGIKPIDVDFRLVAATHRDLRKMCDQGSFRQDLYFRINVINITVPPLKERPEDIPELVRFFLQQFNQELGKSIQGFDSRALKVMESYPWPGNIRELKNVIERIVVLSDKTIVSPEQLPFEMINAPNNEETSTGSSLAKSIQVLERNMVSDALRRTKGNKSKAAKLLSISRPTLDKKLNQYNIDIFEGL